MSGDRMEELRAESDRQTAAILAMTAELSEEQQAHILELAAQSHRAADWLVSYLSERQGGAS